MMHLSRFIGIRRRAFSGLLVSALLLAPLQSFAQTGGSSSSVSLPDACRLDVEAGLAREHRLYRRILFGLPRAAEESTGAVRYDREGSTWFKSAANTWRSQSKGFTGTTWSDALVDEMVERDPLGPSDEATFRRGIFATRGVLTSELIPPLTQSFRALQCRALSVCEAMRKAFGKEVPQNGIYLVQIPGCRELPVRAPVSCNPKTDTPDVGTRNSVVSACEGIAEALIAREAELLKLSVTYDAAYRSLLQFAGTFDDFLSVFRLDLLKPIRQSLPLLHQLSRIPCFLSQCNG